MATCILHVGMHKTGTSSLQRSLYFGLEDPAFRHVGLGHPNAAPYLEAIFSDRPEDFWIFRWGAVSPAKLRSMREDYGRRLRQALRAAKRRGQTPIISSERCWLAAPTTLERLRDLLADEGFGIRVVAYVRPIKSFFESYFQEHMKWSRRQVLEEILRIDAADGRGMAHWSGRLGEFERIFGRESLTVRPFVRSALVDGCAVRDFHATLGIAFDPRSVMRANDSVSLDAVRLLYAHVRFRPEAARVSLRGRNLLLRRLQALDGPPFRFHSSVFAPFVARIDAENRLIRDRYGIDIAEDLEAADGGACVRDEPDFFRFSPASLDWLAKESGLPPIEPREGEAAAREVAVRMQRIQRRPSWSDLSANLAYRFRVKFRRLRHGD